MTCTQHLSGIRLTTAVLKLHWLVPAGCRAAMSDDEREAFDEEIRLTLKEVDRGVDNLKHVAPSIGSESGPALRYLARVEAAANV